MSARTASLLVLAALSTLAGCGGQASGEDTESLSSLETRSSTVVSVRFTTSSSIAENPAPAEDFSVTGSAVRSLYSATLALPPSAAGLASCPSDFGVLYHLTFTDGGGQTVMEADVDPGGCNPVTIHGVSGTLVAGGAYWTTLTTSLGIDESMIYPYVAPVSDDGPGPVSCGPGPG